MQHPDFAVKNSKGQDEAIASLTISNSCSGNQPLKLDLGAYRQVCSNGLVAFDAASESSKIQHTRINAKDLDLFIFDLSTKSDKLIKEIHAMKDKNMSYDEIKRLAYNAAKLRFNEDDDKFNIDALLKVNRVEDKNNDVWTVFNRIQENLTYDVISKEEDIRINQQLFELVNREMAYA
jgi:type II secretory pathway component PulK